MTNVNRHYSFNFTWYSIYLHIVRQEKLWGKGVFLINYKILAGRYCTFVPVRVRATVKLSAAFFHDESSITIGGYESAIAAPKFFVKHDVG